MSADINPAANQHADVLEHFFRHQYRDLIAKLVHRFGPEHLEDIQDAVQEALLRAARQWGYQHMPDKPFAWLHRVAYNRFIDMQRRAKKTSHPEQIVEAADEASSAHGLTEVPRDELLMMIFACCHPGLQHNDQLLLALRLLCGLSVREIAACLLRSEQAVQKNLTRAKSRFRKKVSALELPLARELPSRLQDVLRVLYTLFNSGYKAHEGDALIKQDICEEAMRLTAALLDCQRCEQPPIHALLALMCFNAARFEARQSPGGELIILAEQDRALWDKTYLSAGMQHLDQSASGQTVSAYHLEAAIAGNYCSALAFAETDWRAILELYNQLLKLKNTPVVAMNRIVVVSQVHGPARALTELDALSRHESISKHYLFSAVKADLLIQLDRSSEAKILLAQAADGTANSIERKFLLDKIRLLA